MWSLSLSHSGRKLVGVRVVVRSPSLLPRSLAYLLLLPHAAHIYTLPRHLSRARIPFNMSYLTPEQKAELSRIAVRVHHSLCVDNEPPTNEPTAGCDDRSR